MRRVLAAALLAICGAPALAQTQAPPQVWLGDLRCGPIPGVSTIPLIQPIQIYVTGGVAHYERAVRRPDTASDTDVREVAQGKLAPDGSVQLKGSATSSAYRFTSEFSGRLPPGGGTAQLTGTQHWVMQRANSYDRPCTITATPAPR